MSVGSKGIGIENVTAIEIDIDPHKKKNNSTSMLVLLRALTIDQEMLTLNSATEIVGFDAIYDGAVTTLGITALSTQSFLQEDIGARFSATALTRACGRTT
ncbi:hypothetical protein EVAR_69551_1 [Eumeta japonica]|uniref:Uncharacterized protein n=1 Tax=Eumeta variegata TaxID=151549 RepID=A0A4C2A0E5_EUMVA|nr:hypothetical protein EVAR_69551_1 [Eumeta japonica]